MKPVTLFASSHSLYSGRARSYLIKAAIPFEESFFSTPHYMQDVLPKAGNRQGMPTLALTDGTVIRDGAAIIDYFESESGNVFSPASPKQQILSRLLDVIGAEGLLRPAMHYRWNFDEQNLAFLFQHFSALLPREMQEYTEKMMNSMREAGRNFGVVPDTFELVESLYETALLKMNNHFAEVPYLLGGKPCIGDFGLLAPMYAHLGRDPKPLSLMQATAINVFRWVERMNRPGPDKAEFVEMPADYLPGDEIPETLIELLRHLAIDFLPETQAAADTINQWLADNNVEPGTTAERAVGFADFEIEGTPLRAIAQPYRFYLLARLQNLFQTLSEEDQVDVSAMLANAGLEEILELRLTRDIGRQGNLEVWL